MKSMFDDTLCTILKISYNYFFFHNLYFLGFESQTSWYRNINELLVKPFNEMDFHF